MKKTIKSMLGSSTAVLALCTVLTLSACSTYQGQGAYVGAQFGSILGSAIGGISGGWRGSDIGTIVGMAGGAVVGAAIGSAADKKREEQQQAAREEWQQRQQPVVDETGSADDRIDFDAPGPRTADRRSGDAARPTPAADRHHEAHLVEIRHARLTDADGDGVIRAGEECHVSFEVMNRSHHVLRNVTLEVAEVTRNKHVHISPNLSVESIAPQSGVRYTATVLADRKLRDGKAVLRLGVTQDGRDIAGNPTEFTVDTRRK